MSEGNGVAPREKISAATVERMTDASELPPPPGAAKSASTATPRHGARRRDMTVKPETAPAQALSDEAVTQAAREEIYRQAPVTENLHPIFNKLMPEEIMYMIAYMQKVYERGIEHADDGTAVREAFERGQASVADGPPMRRLVELTEGVLKASTEYLEVDAPDIGRFLTTKDKLFAKFQANTGA